NTRGIRLRGGLSTRVSARFATTTTNCRHVFAIPTHCHAALSAGVSCFGRIEFVRGALGMRRPTALTGDFALLFTVHRGEAAIAATPCRCGRALASSEVLRATVLLAAKRGAIVVARSIRH